MHRTFGILEDPKSKRLNYSLTCALPIFQNPKGAMQAICQLGNEMNLPVTSEEVKEYLSTIDDLDTKQWLIKARGGL